MSKDSLAAELARDLGFTDSDARLLGDAADAIEPWLRRVVDRFYEVIVTNPRTGEVFDDEAQIERQKEHLGHWLRGLFQGTYDDAYWAVRERIGRTHVRIDLEQRYMVSMMGVVRTELAVILGEAAVEHRWSTERTVGTRSAMAKLLDLELAVMLETYQEAFVRRARVGERLATIGQVAATIGHELRNPLAVIDSSLALVRRRAPDEPKLIKHLDRIGGQVKIADTIITNLLAMVRDQPAMRARVSLAELVANAWDGVQGHGEIAFEIDVGVGEVWVDPSHLRQLLVNLFQNAVEAGASRIALTARALHGGELELCVDDDGRGLPHDAENWLFQPLATARVGGSGLGLALCQRIVDKHGGSIEAERLERGTRLRARFGAALDPAAGEGR